MAELATLSGCINGYSDRYRIKLGAVSNIHDTYLQRVNATGGNLGGVGIVKDGGVSVRASRLDRMLDLNTIISVMKLVIEGHEDKALYVGMVPKPIEPKKFRQRAPTGSTGNGLPTGPI